MKRMIVMATFAACIGLFAQTAFGNATVELTSDVSTVAEGGNVTFTITVTPDTYTEKVILTYEGEAGQDEDTTSPYIIVHQFNTSGDDITVTATVEYNNGDPDGQDTLDVDVVGLTITGNPDPPRGWPVGYLAESNPSGKAIDQFDWTYAWSGGSNAYQDNDTDDDNKSTWSGKIVVNGTLTCSATISGVNVQGSKVLTVTPRNWTVSISCAQDNESDWGDVPTITGAFGQHRDRDSDNSGFIFVPRNSGNDWTCARTISQVPSGPCEGWWYVSGSILKCQQETVISKYIKSDGPELGGQNFYSANQYCFSSSVADYVQAVKNHEYRGTPDTYKSIEGHHGRTEKSILDYDNDAKKHLESLTNRVRFLLECDIDYVIASDEDEVIFFAGDESYMQTYGPNWGSDVGALGDGQNSRWDSGESEWTACVNGPDEF